MISRFVCQAKICLVLPLIVLEDVLSRFSLVGGFVVAILTIFVDVGVS